MAYNPNSRKSTNIEDRRHLKAYKYTAPNGTVMGTTIDPKKLARGEYGSNAMAMVAKAVLQDRAAVERYRRNMVVLFGRVHAPEAVTRRKPVKSGRVHDPSQPFSYKKGLDGPTGKLPFTPLTDVGMQTRFVKK